MIHGCPLGFQNPMGWLVLGLHKEESSIFHRGQVFMHEDFMQSFVAIFRGGERLSFITMPGLREVVVRIDLATCMAMR